MYQEYFNDYDVNESFTKEFISLWSGWLGKDNLYKLDKVTESEWGRFNQLLSLLSKEFKIKIASCKNKTLIPVSNIENVLPTYIEAMNKDSSMFSKYVLPELNCVITEDWDFTYILWYKDKSTLEKIIPYIEKANLCHFS